MNYKRIGTYLVTCLLLATGSFAGTPGVWPTNGDDGYRLRLK